MGKSILLLAALTSIAMLLAVFAVMEYSVPITAASFGVVIVFVILAALLGWRGSKNQSLAGDATPDHGRKGLKWLYLPYVIGAVYGLVMALKEGWNVGHTVGAIFFGIFSLLIAGEWLRRRRATRSR